MNSAASIQSISLYYREGGSDKVYHVQLQEVEGGYVVNFQYGRRGSTLQTGSKTTTPVSRSQAEKTFARLVAEKKSKGYTEGPDGTPYTGAEQNKEPSGYLPQLSNFIEEDKTLSLLDDVDWFMQEKANGARQLIQRTGDTITAANRKGLVIPISHVIEDSVRSIKVKGNADFVLDGEAMGDVFAPFDVIRLAGVDVRLSSALSRYGALKELLATTTHGALRQIRTAFWSSEKRKLFTDLQSEKAEGVVFKRRDSKYVAGRPASMGDHLKFKFYTTATLGVIALNSKRSVQLGAWTIRGWQFVGNVTIPANHTIPKPLSMVEVRYLYRYPDGSLFQPTYLGPRTDKDIPDDLTWLKLKPATSEEDES